jgi:hypothetical protein
MFTRRPETKARTDDTGDKPSVPLAGFCGGLAVLMIFWPDLIEAD